MWFFIPQMKASRALMLEVGKKHAALPFSLRNLLSSAGPEEGGVSGEAAARMGVVEPVKQCVLLTSPRFSVAQHSAIPLSLFTVES
jgi:hypothetical protein